MTTPSRKLKTNSQKYCHKYTSQDFLGSTKLWLFAVNTYVVPLDV